MSEYAPVGSRRNLLFALLLAASLIIFWTPLATLLHYDLLGDNQYDKYSYTMAIPFISATLIYLEKKQIFARVSYGIGPGIALLLTAFTLYISAALGTPQIGTDVSLSLQILGLVAFWLGSFVLCFGFRSMTAGAFPLLFLILFVPIPDALLDKPITAVQYGSTDVCSIVFTLAGVPALRSGLQFSLSSVTIEVAKECSGIHSTLAIVLISLIAGHLFLTSTWKKVALVLVALPIVCVTNGLRIAGLTILAEYVNRGFLEGNLHRKGGMGFFVLALAAMFGVLQLLRSQNEKSTGGSGTASPVESHTGIP